MTRKQFLPRIGLVLLLVATASTPVWADNPASVVGSKHDLTPGGTGPVTSTEKDTCVFCHGTHLLGTEGDENKGRLWNKTLPAPTYAVYSSTTYNAAPGDVTTTSTKQCLSCHDGSIAPGMTYTRGAITTSGSMVNRAMNQPTLARDHPVGFQPVDDGQMDPSLFQSPPTTGDPAVTLRNNRVECVTCHNPHEPARDPVAKMFLVRSNESGALCLACHAPARPQPNALGDWTTSAHATAIHTTPSATNFGPYGTVASNACGNCHLPHSRTGSPTVRLVRAPEENTCMFCHESSPLTPALRDIGVELGRAYAHPVTTVSGVHDPVSDGAPVTNARHAECADCHNPHGAGSPGATNPPGVRSSQVGAAGYNGTTALRPAANQYETCFRCHADSPNKPQAAGGFSAYGRLPQRLTDQTATDPANTRLEFESLVSRHNVSSPRGGSGSHNIVPSLRPTMLSTGRPLASGTYIYCTDCHNSSSAREFGGAGPNGPHGSDNSHLLVRNYSMNPLPVAPGGSLPGVPLINGATTYGVCNNCHYIDRGENDDAVLNDRTFGEHDKHVRGADVSCATCHEPHGIQNGNLTNNSNLINFDLGIVAPLPGELEPHFEDLGANTGRCFLVCHNETHNGWNY